MMPAMVDTPLPFAVGATRAAAVGALLALIALGAAFLALRGRYLVPLAAAMNMASRRKSRLRC